ncbi:uncharacterized protein LOC112052118 [Bicyclus anynana]|uniref:Glycine N-acyltransferase-like protein n=1 Tax=Bicyclus anynana TaxID=110368 RepID=A0A6J1NIR4_BICAN|nr:uncharacterized protein LOC112052118 [Bicyclus anynana]
MLTDPLVYMPVDRWSDLKAAFKADWPRSVSGYLVLETQEHILSSGIDYGFKVYCPFGNVNNGIVALNIKKTYYEVIIQCPTDDTRELEDALSTTKIIDWKRCNQIPFAPRHVMDCVKRLLTQNNLSIEGITMTQTFILDNEAAPYDVRLPPGFSFDLLTLDAVEAINECWPHKYPGSQWYYELLTKAKLGYGLYNGNELISWVYIKEMGALGHLYTMEKHRRKGYGELVLKLISNVLLKDKKYTVAFCTEGNSVAANMYMKLGFQLFHELYWCNKHYNIE